MKIVWLEGSGFFCAVLLEGERIMADSGAYQSRIDCLDRLSRASEFLSYTDRRDVVQDALSIAYSEALSS